MLYAEYVVVFVILLPSPHPYYSAVNFVIFQALAFLAITSHLRAMFSDPVRIFYLFIFSFNSIFIVVNKCFILLIVVFIRE